MSSLPVLGIYAPGDTLLHRAAPRTKMGLLLAGGVAIMLTRSPWVLLSLVAALALFFMRARIPMTALARQLRSLGPLLAVLFLAHVWLSGWRTGLLVDLRILALVLGATAVTLTTRLSDMLDQLESLARPLRRVGVSPARLALTVSMTIRFVPLLAGMAHQVREAQRARGVERSFLSLLVPLLVKALQLADRTAEALQARGVD